MNQIQSVYFTLRFTSLHSSLGVGQLICVQSNEICIHWKITFNVWANIRSFNRSLKRTIFIDTSDLNLTAVQLIINIEFWHIWFLIFKPRQLVEFLVHVTKFYIHKLQFYLVDIQLSTKLWQFVCKATREKENIRGEYSRQL